MTTRGLALEVGGRRLIDGVNLTVAEGRRLFLMGANGAGKSLLLRLLHGLRTPTAGAVHWRGEPLGPAARKRQAMVFQRPILLRRSVIGNLRWALRVRGVEGSERRDREQRALRDARLEHMAQRPARLLSEGERQRLAVVRALSTAPEMLLLDEPTSSLDPASVHAIEALVLAANARGATVVMVTHDQGQARRLADDVAFLHEGRLAEHGPAREVLDSPRSEAAKAWLGGRLYFEREPQSGP